MPWLPSTSKALLQVVRALHCQSSESQPSEKCQVAFSPCQGHHEAQAAAAAAAAAVAWPRPPDPRRSSHSPKRSKPSSPGTGTTGMATWTHWTRTTFPSPRNIPGEGANPRPLLSTLQPLNPSTPQPSTPQPLNPSTPQPCNTWVLGLRV